MAVLEPRAHLVGIGMRHVGTVHVEDRALITVRPVCMLLVLACVRPRYFASNPHARCAAQFRHS